MRKSIRLTTSLVLFIAVHLCFAIESVNAQALPPICTLNGPWLTGPEFLEGASMTAQDIRNFLQGKKSWLVGEPAGQPNAGMVLDTDGTTWFDFAQAVIDAAAYPNRGDPGPISPKPINPKILLAMVQKESSMIRADRRPPRNNDSRLTLLTGCGAPSNMREQLQCAARTLRNRFDELVKCQNVSSPPWNLNLETLTRDGVTVKPWNASIAAQYVYNPVAGVQLGGNNVDYGGVGLFCRLWHQPQNQGGLGLANPPTTPKLGPTSPTLTCSDPLARRDVSMSIAGGTQPYTWAAKNSQGVNTGTITACGPNQEDAVLRPPENTGSNVLGTAYIQYGASASYAGLYCTGAYCLYRSYVLYGCNNQIRGGNWLSCSQTVGCAVSPYPLVCNATNTKQCLYAGGLPPCDSGIGTGTAPLDYLRNHPGSGAFCDERSPAMKAANCKPCYAEMQGTTITVTDGAGNPVTVPLTLK